MSAHAAQLLPLIVLLCACTSPPPVAAPTHTGWTDAAGSGEVAAAAPAAPVPTFALVDALGQLVEVAQVDATGHPGRRGPARTLASPTLGSYRSLGPGLALATGTVVVEAYPASASVPAVYYGMQRRDDGWAYAVTDERGTPRPENLAQCARCHADAPNQGLFGGPKPP